jgi:leucyl/phenylalanyl-tRNA--protein transferase
MIPWLRPGTPFPPVDAALRTPNGLLCVTQEVTPDRLIEAYARGIFPWYSADEPVLWWSPDPRMVLPTAEFRISRSLGKQLKRLGHQDPEFTVTLDQRFEDVMRTCGAPRDGQDGTWITEPMVAAYVELHRRGLAHSVETWRDGQLVGGLYGVALGRMFYGESMFTQVTDASKIALACLVRLLSMEKVPVIDCQQNTSHLASLGAREIARSDFCAHVATAVRRTPIDWPAYAARPLNLLFEPGVSAAPQAPN